MAKRVALLALVAMLGSAAWHAFRVMRDAASVQAIFLEGTETLREVRASRLRSLVRVLEAIDVSQPDRARELVAHIIEQDARWLSEDQSNASASSEVSAAVEEATAYLKAHPASPAPTGGSTNPADLFSSARILPAHEGEKLVGIELSQVLRGSRWLDLGFQDGDRILSINGLSLASPAGAAALLKTLAAGESFSAEVGRAGSVVVVSHPAGAPREH